MNGGSLVIASLLIGGIVKYIRWTIKVHQHNIILRKKIGAGAYEEWTNE